MRFSDDLSLLLFISLSYFWKQTSGKQKGETSIRLHQTFVIEIYFPDKKSQNEMNLRWNTTDEIRLTMSLEIKSEKAVFDFNTFFEKIPQKWN